MFSIDTKLSHSILCWHHFIACLMQHMKHDLCECSLRPCLSVLECVRALFAYCTFLQVVHVGVLWHMIWHLRYCFEGVRVAPSSSHRLIKSLCASGQLDLGKGKPICARSEINHSMTGNPQLPL